MAESFKLDSIDGFAWAEHFQETLKQVPGIATDVTTMQGWFANAIMAGYDYGKREASKVDILQNELITYAQCGNVRLQQLVNLFGDMIGDKPDAFQRETHTQRLDMLADLIRNQMQELQTIAVK